ncbi:Hypothetical predicted protein [Pelobates cultripes]|uniref:Uncharacterized protein n=1 Tax=Pelobates cultripes TaxID=61616 RepID=A0AAD1TI59_PELCU|nr:Hypothetical predicted protein [Pelobates cultripes]
MAAAPCSGYLVVAPQTALHQGSGCWKASSTLPGVRYGQPERARAVSLAVPLKVVGGRGRTDRLEEGVNAREPVGADGNRGRERVEPQPDPESP